MFKFSGVLAKYTKSFNSAQIFEAIFSKRLASGVDHTLFLSTIDPIQYDFVETYWRKKYGDKKKGSSKGFQNLNSFEVGSQKSSQANVKAVKIVDVVNRSNSS